jgi:hypothetical protein
VTEAEVAATTEPAVPPPAPERICVTGCPRAGKTTIAETLAAGTGAPPRHTDELIGKFAWGEDSVEVARWFDEPGPWVIEGCTVERALRKWMTTHPEGKPCDVVVFIAEPVQELTKGQESLRKGIATRWPEIRAGLEARGVEIR